METPEKISDRLRMMRRRLGKSLKDVHNDTGISDSLFILMEQGKRKVTDRSIKILNYVYCVSEQWLREGTGEMFCSHPEMQLPETTQEEEELLDKFRQLPANSQRMMIMICEAFIMAKKEKREEEHKQSRSKRTKRVKKENEENE